MTIASRLKPHYVSLALLLLMAATRVHHFGDSFSLPDASLAVFFLAGLKVKSGRFLLVLLAAAAALDYLAIGYFNVSDYCLSPAYVFLIPTYAVVWYQGRYCAGLNTRNSLDSMKMLGWAAFAVTLAFMISNGSFYLFSGRFGAMSFSQYFGQTLNYYPPYLTASLIYIAIGLVVGNLLSAMSKVSLKKNLA